jgi:TM2 domain-containing membrane protein YozV
MPSDDWSGVTIACPWCHEPTVVNAQYCQACGRELGAKRSLFTPQRERKWNPGIAAVLSLVIPGAGQMYKGHVVRGLVWLAVVSIGYASIIVPGLLLHVICILMAAGGDPYKD